MNLTDTAPLTMPAEWERHAFVWIGFPHNADEWPGTLDAARADVAAFANAVQASGEQVRLIVRDEENRALAAALVVPEVELRMHAFGDIWLRDTGPVIVGQGAGRTARRFGFNFWGGKYDMPGDDVIGDALAAEVALPITKCDWILEGGAIDVDGAGLCVTTEQCLLNPNRNPHLSKADIEARLKRDLGVERVLWLGQGLTNDHTDGHVDNLARFIGPHWLAIPEAVAGDPNAEIYADARARAEAFGVSVATIPTVGEMQVNGEAAPASYMNFYIANDRIIVPTYGMPNDARAVAVLDTVFPDRGAVGVRANGILSGGGSLHCCSQQMPL